MASERQRVSLASQTHGRSPQCAETQHSVGEAQALSFDSEASLSQGTQPLPPDFLTAARVQLRCYAGERGKGMGRSVYNLVP